MIHARKEASSEILMALLSRILIVIIFISIHIQRSAFIVPVIKINQMKHKGSIESCLSVLRSHVRNIYYKGQYSDSK